MTFPLSLKASKLPNFFTGLFPHRTSFRKILQREKLKRQNLKIGLIFNNGSTSRKIMCQCYGHPYFGPKFIPGIEPYLFINRSCCLYFPC